MAQVVINAFGGEGTLFTRTFLAALPAWPWKDPANTKVLVRWLDLANQTTGDDGETDASKTRRMMDAVSKDGFAKLLSKVFGAPVVLTDNPKMAEGMDSIDSTYQNHQDRELLSLQFTPEEIAKHHTTGFQGDPCAGTACICGQEQPLPKDFHTPTVNNQQIAPDVWITVGGFRGGGCATTLVPYEAKKRDNVNALKGVTSVLIAALPYSSHEENHDDTEHPQLHSDYAFSGTKAILRGGFEIGNWTKRYFVSSYLKGGQLVRPVTARYSVNEQNTTLIATNLVTADCAYRAIEGIDGSAKFGNDKVFVPSVYVPDVGSTSPKNAFDFNLSVDIKKMRAICWYAALVKELWCGWAEGRHINGTKFKKAENAAARDKVGLMKDYCDKMLAAFEEMQRGRYEGASDPTAMPFKFMPDSFFKNYRKKYDDAWWVNMVIGDTADTSDDFTPRTGGLFKGNSDYSDLNGVSNHVLNPVLNKSKGDIDAALKMLFDRIMGDISNWEYLKNHSSREGQNVCLLLPTRAALTDNFVSFGTKEAKPEEASVMGAVCSEAAKINRNGYIGGECGRFFNFQDDLRDPKPEDLDNPEVEKGDWSRGREMVVKYTSLLLTHFLKDLRGIDLVMKPIPVKDRDSIFAEMERHLGFRDGIHVCMVGGYKVGSYINVDNASSAAYFILPAPGTWGTERREVIEAGKKVVTYYCNDDKCPWSKLVGLNNETHAVPKTIDEVLDDLTDFELLISYTMLYSINHYDPEGGKPEDGGAAAGTLQASKDGGIIGSIHYYYQFATSVLRVLEEKIEQRMKAHRIDLIMPVDAKWSSIDQKDPVCRFIKDQIFPPNKIFTHKLAYYRNEKKGGGFGGIYCAYPFSEDKDQLIQQFEQCNLSVRAKMNSNNDDVESIRVELEYTRTSMRFIVNGAEHTTGIKETRSYTYIKSSDPEKNQLVCLTKVPSISMVPQFLGYDAETQAPKGEFRYTWISNGGTPDTPPRCIEVGRDFKLILPSLPAEKEWKLCQKVQKVGGLVVDGAWSAVSSQEKYYWNLCNSDKFTENYGSLGRTPIKLTAAAQWKTEDPLKLKRPAPTDCQLELYFDFGTANSHIDVYPMENVTDDNRVDEAFVPQYSAYCLTLDLADKNTDDDILKLHAENMTPVDIRKGTIPTMVQIYGKQPDEADNKCDVIQGAAQYDVGRIVYPDKVTMGRIYASAAQRDKTADTNENETVRSLADLGFCDQMKVSSGEDAEIRNMENLRAFFMRGFVQNVIAKYYTLRGQWPSDLVLFCSYPTVALKSSYRAQLSSFLPRPAQPLSPLRQKRKSSVPGEDGLADRLYFYSEALSFVAAIGNNTRNAVTIDIGAGTTDIAICKAKIDGEKKTLYVIKNASLQFAGMSIIEQSIIECLRPDTGDGAPIDSVFKNLGADRVKMLQNMLTDSTKQGEESLRMLVRNLIADFIETPQNFRECLRVRIALRTIGLLLAIREMIDDDMTEYDLFLHGGPVKSLKQMAFGNDDETWSFAAVVKAIFGREPKWDSNKEAITVGMRKLEHDRGFAVETLSINDVTDENRPYLNQPNLNRQQKTTRFDCADVQSVSVHNFEYTACDIQSLAEDVVKAFARRGSGDSVDSIRPFIANDKNEKLRSLVEKIVKAKSTYSDKIQKGIEKCEYYENMDARLTTMYAVDQALHESKNEFKGW